jgi:hypothetical protein
VSETTWTMTETERAAIEQELRSLIRDVMSPRGNHGYDVFVATAMGQIEWVVKNHAAGSAWTRTKPTVPGIYRWRVLDITGGWTNLGGVGEVVITMDGPRLDKFFVTKGVSPLAYETPSPTEWAGPIPPPTESA